MSARTTKLENIDSLLQDVQGAVDAFDVGTTEYTNPEDRLNKLEDEVSTAQKDLEALQKTMNVQRKAVEDAVLKLIKAFEASYDDMYDGMERADEINMLRDAVEDAAIL